MNFIARPHPVYSINVSFLDKWRHTLRAHLSMEDFARSNFPHHCIVRIRAEKNSSTSHLYLELWPEKQEDGRGWFRTQPTTSMFSTLYLPSKLMEENNIRDGEQIQVELVNHLQSWKKVELVIENEPDSLLPLPSTDFLEEELLQLVISSGDKVTVPSLSCVFIASRVLCYSEKGVYPAPNNDFGVISEETVVVWVYQRDEEVPYSGSLLGNEQRSQFLIESNDMEKKEFISCYGKEGERLWTLFSRHFTSIGSNCSPILLRGDAGIGKSFAIKELCRHFHVRLKTLRPFDMDSFLNGNRNLGLVQTLENLEKQYPIVVVFDFIETIFSKKDSDWKLRISLAAFLNRMKSDRQKPLIIGITSNPLLCHPSVLDEFQNLITFGVLSTTQREHFISKFFPTSLLDPTLSFPLIASKTIGFTPADLYRLATLAKQHLNSLQAAVLTLDHFLHALKRMTKPTFHKVLKDIPNVQWDDIGGYEPVKCQLKECITWYTIHKEAFVRIGIRPPRGILLHGPPGTGKTLLAKAVASECNAFFLPISIPDLIKGEVGESEKAVEKVFDMAKKCSPCVIFLDEIDAIFSSREQSSSSGKKIISQLILELENEEDETEDKNVIILAATNNIDRIDPTLLRSGRLDVHILVPPPDEKARQAILKIKLGKHSVEEDAISVLSKKTEGLTGAEVTGMVRKAILNAVKRQGWKETLEIRSSDFEFNQ